MHTHARTCTHMHAHTHTHIGPDPPMISLSDNIRYLIQRYGTVIRVVCSIQESAIVGDSQASLTWTGPGGIKNQSTNELSVTLNLQSFQQNEEGEYVCTARNSRTTVNSSVYVYGKLNNKSLCVFVNYPLPSLSPSLTASTSYFQHPSLSRKIPLWLIWGVMSTRSSGRLLLPHMESPSTNTLSIFSEYSHDVCTCTWQVNLCGTDLWPINIQWNPLKWRHLFLLSQIPVFVSL